MGKFAIASVLVVTLATSALAADAKYYLEMDTVGNCSVVDSKGRRCVGGRLRLSVELPASNNRGARCGHHNGGSRQRLGSGARKTWRCLRGLAY
jgi:hypothetical protein